MKKKPVLIVSGSQKQSSSMTMLQKSLCTMSDNNSIVDKQYKLNMHVQNRRPLPELYNEYISEKYLKKHDIVLFVHDDVYIDDLGCFDKLYNSLFDYGNDIVGLAGTTQATVKKPALWHLMSDKKYHTGHVAHINEKDDTMFTTAFGPYPKRCLLLDGLFLGINIKTVLKADWKFNENFAFHHYDLSSCLDANKKKLKLSTCNIHVVHASPGLNNYYEESFQESEKKFLQLYESNA